jgi:serine/threonine-protein kinase
VAVPKLANASWSSAVSQLRKLGFVAERAPDAFSSTVDAGNVIRSLPAAGTTQPYGSTIRVVVSKGPDLVTMPDVVGTPVGAACRLVRNTGLGCKVTGTLVSGNVASTSVKAGAKVARGTVVTVVVN